MTPASPRGLGKCLTDFDRFASEPPPSTPRSSEHCRVIGRWFLYLKTFIREYGNTRLPPGKVSAASSLAKVSPASTRDRHNGDRSAAARGPNSCPGGILTIFAAWGEGWTREYHRKQLVLDQLGRCAAPPCSMYYFLMRTKING